MSEVKHIPMGRAQADLGNLPIFNVGQLIVLTGDIDTALDEIRKHQSPELYANALLVLAKRALRDAPRFGPRLGAVALRLTANQLEQEAI